MFDLYNAVSEDGRAKIIAKSAPWFTESNLLRFLEQISDRFQQVRYNYEYPIVIFPDGQIAQLARAIYLVCSEEFVTP